eukprot:3602734-Amphidinium_carterae.1
METCNDILQRKSTCIRSTRWKFLGRSQTVRTKVTWTIDKILRKSDSTAHEYQLSEGENIRRD